MRGLAGAREVAALLERLPECTGRDSCDAVAINFCFLATKGARKRMVRFPGSCTPKTKNPETLKP